ncbi:hypothetical protein SCUCBS95973_008955 [Sporothrix curviconia]|uniref:DUF7924 domain-containing protein n=1 Tax=Sporothrix curviconia TaxID=1260050 RepID=A0ABP0CRH1_9PEZI
MGDSESWANGLSGDGSQKLVDIDDGFERLEKKESNDSSRPSLKRQLKECCLDSEPASKRSRSSLTSKNEEEFVTVKAISEWLEVSVPSGERSAVDAGVFPSVEVDEVAQETNRDSNNVCEEEFEFKGLGGDVVAATNQCAGTMAACLVIVDQLNRKLKEINDSNANQSGRLPAPLVDNIVYGAISNGADAAIFVGYIGEREGMQKYFIHRVENFYMLMPGHMSTFRKHVRNILEWGKTTRRAAICAALEVVRDANVRMGPITAAAVPTAMSPPSQPGLSTDTSPQTGDKWNWIPDGIHSSGAASKSRGSSRGRG